MSPPRIAVLVGELMGYALARVESDGRKPPRGVSWASVRAVALVVLMVGSVVATPVLATSTVAATPGESPSGMVGIPDANVQKDVPANHNGKTPTVSELRGSVMASAGAESLEVIISTRGRACAQYLDSCSPSEIRGSEAGEFVLLLRDDVNAEGRRVAIPKDALKRTLGYVPSVIYGTHESGERWTAGVSESGGLVVFDVPHFSTNQVSFEGEVRVHGNYANASTALYDLSDLSSASDPNVTFTGRDATETDTVSAGGLGNGGTFALDVAGSSAATGASVTFNGEGGTGPEQTDSWVNVSGAVPFDSGGNLAPSGPATGEPRINVTGHQPNEYDGTYNEGDCYNAGNCENVPIPYYDKITRLHVYLEDGSGSGSVTVKLYVDGTNVEDFTLTSEGDSTAKWYNFSTTSTYDPASSAEITVNTQYITYLRATDTIGDHPRSVSVDATDGGVATFGTVNDGMTESAGVDITAPATDLTVSHDGGKVDMDVTYNPENGSDSPSIDVNGDGVDDASHAGVLQSGQSATYSLPDLATTDDTASVSLAGGTVGADVTYTEHADTDSPELTLNGNASCVVSYPGVLGAGATYNATLPASCLVQGTNSLDVTMTSVSADAPVPVVNVDYDHSAASKYDVAYSAEAWSERYNVSKTWASDRTAANLTIDFVGNVVTTRDVQVRENGGAWASPVGTSWSGTTVVVDLGSIQSGDVTDVRVNGSKVRVNNGSVQVLNATNQGDALDTRFRVESWNADSYIDVSGTHEDAFTHYTDGESWSSPETYALIADGGKAQKVFLPKASAGSETRIRTVPAEFNPQQDVRVEVVEDDGSPRFRIEPGPVAGDDVTLVYHDTVSGETYELRSIEREMTIAKDTAQSPVYFEFSDDGDLVEIRLLSDDGGDSSGSSSGSSGGFVSIGSGGTDTTETILILLAAAFVLLGAGVLGRRRGVPTWAAGGTVALVFVVVVESVSPGAISGPIAETIAGFGGGLATVAPALWLGGGLLVIWGGFRFVKKFTRKEEVVITGFRGGK